MALQNRVTPAGEIISTTARGTIMGNRGILHDDNKRIVRTSRNIMWLICQLEFKGRRRELMSPGTYTELFFLDEAVALAAGHRPCGECRRTQYRSYIAAVNDDSHVPLDGPKDLDRRLKESRRAPRGTAAIASLPDGVFVTLADDDYRLIWNGALHRWSPNGYVDTMPVANACVDRVDVMTPSLSVAALRRGYHVEVHPTAATADKSPRITTGTDEVRQVSELTPELQDEIKRHLRSNPVRHGEVFRAMEQGLSVDQMGTSRANAQNFLNSVRAMLAGTLPVTKSAARTNSFGYRYLLGCDLSPELRDHTKRFLRRLAKINPDEVRIDEPLHIRKLPANTTRRRVDAGVDQHEKLCLQCNLTHTGECD